MVKKKVRSAAVLFLLLAFLCVLSFGAENRTAYTRDGVHFVSKERMEENILYEYARADDYREVQVPPDTIVVGASVIPERVEEEEQVVEEGNGDEKQAEGDSTNEEENAPRYPYATIGVGLLLICGLVASLAWIRSHRSRRRRRSLRRR